MAISSVSLAGRDIYLEDNIINNLQTKLLKIRELPGTARESGRLNDPLSRTRIPVICLRADFTLIKEETMVGWLCLASKQASQPKEIIRES